MPIKVREGNTWKLVANASGIPGNITGSYVHYGSTRVADTIYTNTQTRLVQINATIGIDRNNSLGNLGIHLDLIAGSYIRAFIAPPSSSTLLSNPLDSNGNVVSGLIEVASIRDNGNQNTKFLYLNPQFFVPINFSYIIKLYDSDDNDWSQNTTYPNAVETFAWSEYRFALQ